MINEIDEMDKTKSHFLGAESYGSEIVEYLLKGKKVIINHGCANDNIIGYTSYNDKYNEYDKFEFTTTACIFPEKLLLSNFDYIRSEQYDGNLFVYFA